MERVMVEGSWRTRLPRDDGPFAMIGEVVLLFPPYHMNPEPGVPVAAVVVEDNRQEFMEEEVWVVVLSRKGCEPIKATFSMNGEPGTWNFRNHLATHLPD